MDIKELQLKVIEWGRDKGLNDPLKQTLKTVSEVGELADAIAKGNEEEIKDAIGDSFVCLIILQDILGYSEAECLQAAFDVISKRTGKTINGTFVKQEELDKM